jgi:hypothetical protein
MMPLSENTFGKRYNGKAFPNRVAALFKINQGNLRGARTAA